MTELAEIVGASQVRYNEPMSEHTTFKIGGPCDVFVMPQTVEQLAQVIACCEEKGYTYMLLGEGSNLLVRDGGIAGVVISTSALKGITFNGNEVYAEAGLSMAELCQAIQKQGLSGLAFACGIPGSLGGAVFMNAGAYNGELKDVVKSVVVCDTKGNIATLPAAEMDFSYRHSRLRDEKLFCLAATLALKPSTPEAVQAEMDDYTAQRESKQPLEWPSAGSTFKRPKGYFAGKLIIDSGLQGTKVGGAMVSTKHAGFIINCDHATAADVLALIHKVQEGVWNFAQVKLETEVCVIGREKEDTLKN